MLEQNLPPEIQKNYPFAPQFFTNRDGHKIHYVDRGLGEPIFLVHGNPSWSFYYRELIKKLESHFRVIAIDHLGCGLSDKPQDYDYSLQNHINNLEELKSFLNIKKYSMVVHDWGGAIGCGMAIEDPKQLKSLVILNTAAFRSQAIPFRINLCRLPFFGEKLVRTFNAFAWPATFMAVRKRMSPEVKTGYLYPYNNYKNRIATARFVQDIPLEENHPSYLCLKKIEENLHKLEAKKLILWGEKDFCFTMQFYKRWLDFFPNAESEVFPQAGHYILEDEKVAVTERIFDFFSKTIHGD